MMMEAYPEAYGARADGQPEAATIASVVGSSYANESQLGEGVLALFDDYHRTFVTGSKPAAHLRALSTLTNEDLMAGLPDVLQRLVVDVSTRLRALPE